MTRSTPNHKTWVTHDGPPFAHGKSHIGNLYNRTLKDIINRYKLLLGYRVHFVPGFDCFGPHVEDAFASLVAVEKQVEALEAQAAS